jgi:hypothetical protein
MDVLIRSARATEADILTDLALRSKAHWGYDADFLEACRDELTVAAHEVARRRTTVAERDATSWASRLLRVSHPLAFWA